jgi:hypothetical protein
MATTEERMRILKMVEEGKLSPEVAAKLLAALTEAAAAPKAKAGAGASAFGGAQAPFQAQGQGARARQVRIRVIDARRGQAKSNIDVNLPIGLVGVIARLADRFVPPEARQGVDINAIWQAVENGATGKIVDVTGENGERVEITLE